MMFAEGTVYTGIFFYLNFNKLRRLNKWDLRTPEEHFKVLRVELNMLIAPS